MFDIATAQQIMRRDLITVRPETPVLPAIGKMLEANISGAPVVDADGKYLGVFSEKCSLNALTDLVRQAESEEIRMPPAREFMKKQLVKLTPAWDVFAAIEHILRHRISGAPVVDEQGHFVGVFSEKTAMRVLMAALLDSVPGSPVQAFLNLDRNRIIDEETRLPEVASKFQTTPYRRLPVLRGSKLLGQISRRDVLRSELGISSRLASRISGGSTPQGDVEHTAGRVGDFLDSEALTVTPDTDMLAIAQLFLNSTFRRLPVLDENRQLLGQISRRDLLSMATERMQPEIREKYSAATLYLSQVQEEAPACIK